MDHGWDNTLRAFDYTLGRLGLDYLDLYLIHFPGKLNEETWSALENIYSEGRVRAIGVSNYSIKDIESILENQEIVPAVNQILMHPLIYAKTIDLIEYCESEKIYIEAYSPLVHGFKLDLERFQEVADKYSKSVPQVLIRWSLERGFITIPRSSNKNHIEQNARVFDFELSDRDLSRLDATKLVIPS